MVKHNGEKFSTKDNDNDSFETNCATSFKGGWWYKRCHRANLNGLYLNGTDTQYAVGMVWKTWNGYYYSFMKTKMMIRRNKKTQLRLQLCLYKYIGVLIMNNNTFLLSNTDHLQQGDYYIRNESAN